MGGGGGGMTENRQTLAACRPKQEVKMKLHRKENDGEVHFMSYLLFSETLLDCGAYKVP